MIGECVRKKLEGVVTAPSGSSRTVEEVVSSFINNKVSVYVDTCCSLVQHQNQLNLFVLDERPLTKLDHAARLGQIVVCVTNFQPRIALRNLQIVAITTEIS